MDNVHRLTIPTPFHVGPVNCYVFTGAGLTLLDPGPATAEAYAELTTGLNELGFAIADVDQVFITHPHMDHFGLANRVATESGACTIAHHDATKRLRDPVDHFKREQKVFGPFLCTMGAPEDAVASAMTLPEAYIDYQDALSIDHELNDGDTVDVGSELTALHTPGHAPGSVCFLTQTADVAFTGDHVLNHITPNPLLTVRPGSEAERTRSLPTYLDSLERLQQTNADVGEGGHGERIPDLNSRIKAIIDHHQNRKERIAEMITKRGPISAYEIMRTLFPNLPATELFPGMSEVIGHLDLLTDEARVHSTVTKGIRQYSLR